MEKKNKTIKDVECWNWRSWLWVLLCVIGILSIVPVARAIQRFISDTVGREFFTYLVFFIVVTTLTALLYIFIVKLRIKNISQYIWLFVCSGAFIYLTLQLRKSPEETIHLLEYSLLSYFLFKALSYRIKDWTIYFTSIFFVLSFGIIDEFLQWIIPGRYWGIKDVKLNTLASGIFLLGIWKGIRPKIINNPIKKFSIQMLRGIIMLNLILIGLCLSNTPDNVNRYTGIFNILSWLRQEEPMTEFGYKHNDPEIGTFYSRMNLRRLKELDLTKGELYGKILHNDIDSGIGYTELLKTYNPNTNPFLYEFLIHLSRREENFNKFTETHNLDEKIWLSKVAFKENLLIKKYFGNTLKHSGFKWPDERVETLKKTSSSWSQDYISKAGNIITSFSLHTGWLVIIITLIIVWTSGELLKRQLDN
jgi:VanZ family protein